jgi:hypothetical protein
LAARAPRACAHKSACRAPPWEELFLTPWADPAVPLDAVRLAVHLAWVDLGVLGQVVLDVLVRLVVLEIVKADRLAFEEPGAEGLRVDSRARLAEADSNSVSEEPWQRQADGQSWPAWRLLVQLTSGGAALAASILLTALILQALQ